MSVENKIARLMRDTGPARFFIPVGIILIVFGIVLLGFKTDKYVETSGVISSVTAAAAAADEEQQYDVKVKYTVEGKEYETAFNNLSGNFKTGDSIKVYYDPADPEKTTNSKGAGFIAPVMIIVGAAALLFGAFKTVQAFKKSKQLDNTAGGSFPKADFENYKEISGVKEIYFRFDGHSLKPGYIVEDADRRVLFEGKMTKQALVGARTFEFVNHTNGTSASHEVGHTTTQSYNEEFLSVRSWFKFDGENVWDVLHNRGIRLNTNMHSKFPYCIYEAALNGKPFARIETSSIYVHEDDEASHSIIVPAGNMYYRIWTATDDLDLLFLTVFAISETEQAIVE